jgi:hypothetical protein
MVFPFMLFLGAERAFPVFLLLGNPRSPPNLLHPVKVLNGFLVVGSPI